MTHQKQQQIQRERTYYCFRCKKPVPIQSAMKKGDAIGIGFMGKMFYFHEFCLRKVRMDSILLQIKNHIKKGKKYKKPGRIHIPDSTSKIIALKRIIQDIKDFGPSTRRQIAVRTGIDKSTVGYRIWANDIRKNPSGIFKIVGHTNKGEIQIWGLVNEKKKPNNEV